MRTLKNLIQEFLSFQTNKSSLPFINKKQIFDLKKINKNISNPNKSSKYPDLDFFVKQKYIE